MMQFVLYFPSLLTMKTRPSPKDITMQKFIFRALIKTTDTTSRIPRWWSLGQPNVGHHVPNTWGCRPMLDPNWIAVCADLKGRGLPWQWDFSYHAAAPSISAVIMGKNAEPCDQTF